MASVLLCNLTKVFSSSPRQSKDAKDTPGRPVLDDINLTINDGEFMVLVGPSGCGKSTLLRLISGLETLTSGEIQIGDRIVNHLPPKQRDIAMVFQSYALYPHLSVYDNLAFGLRRALPAEQSDAEMGLDAIARSNPIEKTLVGVTRRLPKRFQYLSAAERSIADRVHTVAQMLQIETLLNRLPKQLSGGQKQRVALGRAMARNPQVFLMDEPLSNLDAKLRTETRAQIVNLQKQLKTTTIYVTHDQTEAMTMGDRIAVMNQGKLQQVAPPLELYRHPANKFVAAFIGSPPMNFLEVTVKAGQLVHPQFSLALSSDWKTAIAAYTNRPLILGIRPEHISVGQQPGSFAVCVVQYEALGSETYATTTLDSNASDSDSLSSLIVTSESDSLLQIRVLADQPIERGSTLQITFPQDKIHLFDPQTEQSITLQKAS